MTAIPLLFIPEEQGTWFMSLSGCCRSYTSLTYVGNALFATPVGLGTAAALPGTGKSTAPGMAVTQVGALGVLCPHRKPGLTHCWESQHRQIGTSTRRASSGSHCLAVM